MAAIDIVGLEKWYEVGFWRKKPRCALRPLTLSVEEGEIFGYLGPNGAGKTTTLKLLMGLIFPTRGTARILGMELGDRRVKAQMGFLPEQPYFYDYLTAGELLNYLAQLSGVAAGERKRRVEATLARVGVPEAINLQLRKLSKGMMQRVGLAQAILHDPKIVFLDEPMSGLDPLGRLEVRDLIQQLKDEGKTVFFSTHILADAEALCDRVAVLNKGELCGVGVTADLRSRASGKVEIVFKRVSKQEAGLREAAAILAGIALESHISGEVERVVVRQEQLNAALDAVRRAGTEIVSVNPLRSSLEEYFVERLKTPAEKPGAPSEVTR
jgi:ABC-2 type transport system ATP-binding protein